MRLNLFSFGKKPVLDGPFHLMPSTVGSDPAAPWVTALVFQMQSTPVLALQRLAFEDAKNGHYRFPHLLAILRPRDPNSASV
jgi:hypothetical protein